MKGNFNDSKTLAEKIVKNSVWEVYEPNFFYQYSAEKAEEMTKAGRKALSEIMKVYPK